MSKIHPKKHWLKYALTSLLIIAFGGIVSGCAPVHYNTKNHVNAPPPQTPVKQNYNPPKPNAPAPVQLTPQKAAPQPVSPGFVQPTPPKSTPPKVSQTQPVSSSSSKALLADKSNNKPEQIQPVKATQPGNNTNNAVKPNQSVANDKQGQIQSDAKPQPGNNTNNDGKSQNVKRDNDKPAPVVNKTDNNKLEPRGDVK